MEKKIFKIALNPKVQEVLNESVKFLFIGQGQVDIWQHFISLLEYSKFKNLEFDTKNNIFV